MYAREQMELERKLLDGIAKCNDLVAKERDKYKKALELSRMHLRVDPISVQGALDVIDEALKQD